MGRQALLYLTLRTANSGAAVLWGFLVTFVMVRALGLQAYSTYVLVTAIGVYLSAADVGISRLVYTRLRKAFLSGDLQAEAAPALGALLSYGLVVVVALALFPVAGAIAGDLNGASGVDLWLYFLFTALNLPWLLVRYMAWSLERHVIFDLVDLARRLVQTVLLLLVLAGLEVRAALIGFNLIWAGAFGVGLALVLPPVLAARAGKGGLLSGFWSEYAGDTRPSLIFSLAEFATYNLPYLLIPLVYGAGAPLVAFDLFYKLFRAGVTGSQIASAGLLPQQTRAFFAGDQRGLARATVLVFAFSAAAAAILAAILLIGWRELFPLLLDGAQIVQFPVVVAIIVAVFGNALQNTSGSLLVHLGFIRHGSWAALLVLGAMGLMTAAVVLLGLSSTTFIALYAAVYFCGAVLWAWVGVDVMVKRRAGAGASSLDR